MDTAETVRLAEIRGRADIASDGPWILSFPEHATDPLIHLQNDEALATVHGFSWDAEFIANAREDIPFLLAGLEDHKTEIARLISERDAWGATMMEFVADRNEIARLRAQKMAALTAITNITGSSDRELIDGILAVGAALRGESPA